MQKPVGNAGINLLGLEEQDRGRSTPSFTPTPPPVGQESPQQVKNPADHWSGGFSPMSVPRTNLKSRMGGGSKAAVVHHPGKEHCKPPTVEGSRERGRRPQAAAVQRQYLVELSSWMSSGGLSVSFWGAN